MFNDDSEWDLAILSYIHDHIIEASGGSKGFHNEGLVKSALARPLHSVMGGDAYPDVFSKAAALLDAIANNHGFRDGNKRTAMAAAVLYLEQNDMKVAFTNQEYEDIMLHVVNDKPPISEIKEWLERHAGSRS